MDLAFNFLEIDQLSTSNSWGLFVVKNKLSSCIGYAVEAIKFFSFLNNGNNHYLTTRTVPITEY